MDNFQPLLLNDSNGGKDWVVHGVTEAQVRKRQSGSKAGSKEIYEHSMKLIDKNVEKGNII